ncbi:autotransporter outer membrane beta-barrel domain-containing protein [Pseudomonas viridiflava]|uniref:autotransporter outer membrane beta-barrel domain-containing protein n=1 Tax=Pseudomonas syringae group TaxID=136849 RepID=UPI003D663686
MLNIDSTYEPDNYTILGRGRINLFAGAIANQVLLRDASAIAQIDDSVVRDGLYVLGGKAYVANSRIDNASGNGVISTAEKVHNDFHGAFIELDDSVVTGLGAGVMVGPLSELYLKGTTAFGIAEGIYGDGVRVAGGMLHVSGASNLEGVYRGLYVVDGTGNVPDSIPLFNKIFIDGSTLKGQQGPSILVKTKEVATEIAVVNGASLISGNGNLVEATGGGETDFNVDNSTLNGNLVADDTSTLNVTLQNGAQLNGDIINGNTLAITSGGQWQMQGDNAVKSLSMQGGSVGFAENGFHTLSLNELSGSGTFGMRVDLDNGVGDLINVNGQASGQFGLRVRNTGVEVISADMQPLKVVHTEGGDAQFSLLGGRVDLGAYSYLLEQQGNDWFVVGRDKVISPSTQSALALYSAAPAIWMSELSTLRSRMGEVRASGQAGGWMRAYGSRLNATTSDGVDYRQKQSGLSLGADAPVEVSNGRLLVGVLGGYSTSDLDVSRGTTGKVASYYAGAYGTWLSDDGYYVDGVLKLNRFRNKADVAMSDASKAKGNYSNTGVGGWVEAGRHIKLADDYFLEPFAQLSSVVVQGQELRLDNGMKAKNARTRSVLGKVGTSLGRTVALKDGGVLQPYVRVAVAQEFSRRNEVKANDVKFDNSLFGSRGELGAGVSVSLSERLKLHADVDYMKGQHIEQPWGANVGLRLTF